MLLITDEGLDFQWEEHIREYPLTLLLNFSLADRLLTITI